MAELISMMEAKAGLGLLENPDKDIALASALPYVTSAIETYTGRQFDVVPAVPVATARTFLHDGSGVVVMDDCQHGSITAVTIAGAAVTAGGWYENPLLTEYPVCWWLDIPHQAYGRSPEMGFTRNEDVLAREGRFLSNDQRVTVTAIWGWPEVPGDVKQAAIWAVAAFIDNPAPYVSQSIAGYSRTSVNPMNDGLPPRAMTMLDRHVKR